MTLTRNKAPGRPTHGGTFDGTPAATYQSDPFTWSVQQADLIRNGRFDLIDRAHVAEEIEDLSKRELRATRSALCLVLQHLLKWDAQPERRTRSWILTVRTQRRSCAEQLIDNSGIASMLPMLVSRAYADARDVVLQETGLPEAAFQQDCPYSWDEIMTRPIDWPEQP